MYLVRFCYDLKPTDRDVALKIIREEVAAAAAKGSPARLLVPLTRGPGCPALEYELEVESLDDLEAFRDHGIAADETATHHWMRAFSELLVAPPTVTVYRID
jgi:hypothetical protein